MGTQAFTLYPFQGEGRRKDAKEGIRFVNLHLVPNFETHPWKGRLLGWLGEKDVPRLQRQQLAAIGQEARREGGEEGRWCAVGDFNVHGPEVLGVGSRVTEVGGRRREGGRERGRGGGVASRGMSSMTKP